jgi:hypothetical protein
MKNLLKSNPMRRENTKRRETLEVRLQEKKLLKPQTKGVLEMLAKMLEVVVVWTICSLALIFPNNLMLS